MEVEHSEGTETQKNLLGEQQKVKPSFKNLFKFCSTKDLIFMVAGTLSAFVMGLVQPLLFYLMGDFFNQMGPLTTPEDFYEDAKTLCLYMVIFGGVFIVFAYFAVMLWVQVGARQGMHFRKHYFEKVLQMDPEWFDARHPAELPMSIATDTLKIERASGDKLVIIFFTFSMILTSFIIALVEGTALALIAFCFGPVVAGGLFLTNNGMEQSAKAADTSYRKAGGVAEEALEEIKTVAALNGQKYETQKYTDALKDSQKSMFKNGFKVGMGTGIAIAGFFWMMATIYIVGADVIDNETENWADGETFDVGKVVIVLFVSLMAFNNIGTLVPSIKMIAEGKKAAGDVLEILNTPSQLTQGKLETKLQGSIEFKNVVFSYPTAKDTLVLKGLSFNLEPGQRLGVVGSTGSGKSTIIQLLLRYYEQNSGTVLLDGKDIREYSIFSIRENIGLVSQEPLLFNTTIYENIRYGNKSASEQEIREAAARAGAMEFIEKLPDGLNTNVGSKGGQLSGGQKQRIAIARAIIRRPRILLLDEATSALDRQTEQIVVDALENSLAESTRIVVAQNLLSVRDCHSIIMIDQGEVVEQGSHRELMKMKGKYYHLVKMQKLQQKNQDEEQIVIKTSESNLNVNEQQNEQKDEKENKTQYMKRIISMSKDQMWWLVLGCFGSLLVGSTYPLTGMFSGLQIYTLATKRGEELQDDSEEYAIYLFILSVVVLLGLCMESVSYPRMSSNITKKMREDSFRALLSYEAAFFDMPENNCSALAAKLSNDCEMVNGLGGSVFGIVLGIFSSLAVAHIVAAVFSWRISLVVLAIVPILIFAVASNFMAQMQGVVQFSYENCTSLAADAIINYRTAKAFNLEEEMVSRYLEPVVQEFQSIKKKAHFSALTYGLGFGILFWAYALIFWYGAKLVRDGDISFEDMIAALITAITGSDAFFIAGIYAPDVKNGIEAAKSLLKVLDYKPLIDVNSKEGKKTGIRGKVEFREVSFSYPNRNYMALKKINFEISPGTSLAIIGRTGSGKSTITQLVLRLYDCTHGSVLVDDTDIRDYNIKAFRKQISVVSQEPILFSGTIAENIAYGIKADKDQIEEAARRAQALEFISRNKEGLDREVGLKGSMLSGGQKQRIAIARAIIRNPKILLMDEATSALDSKTEKELLSALDEIMPGRTCITIAHRLKTIEEADQIMVLEAGKIVEFGSRQELYDQGGYFYNLVRNL